MISYKSFCALVAAISIAGFAKAQTADSPSILTVSLAQAMNDYYKVKDFVESMNTEKETAEEAVTQMQSEGEAKLQEFEELRAQSESDILTEDRRLEARQDAIKIQEELMAKDNSIREYVAGIQQKFAAQEQSQMSVFLNDIVTIVLEVQKERGSDLVLDVSGPTRSGWPTVLYANDRLDITEEVVLRANAAQPAQAAEPAATE